MTTQTKPKVWVCMLTHNRSRDLHTALNMPAFARGMFKYGSDEECTLVIQAQACEDDTWDWLSKGVDWLPCHVITHQIDFNLWAIGGRHRQIDWLVGSGDLQPDDVVIFLDDDIRIVGSDWIDMFVDGFAVTGYDRAVGAVGIDGKTYKAGWRDSYSISDGPWPKPVDVVGGGWMAVRGEVLLRGANYDLAQMPFWGGDDDFCLQIRALGYEVLSLGPQEVSGLCHEPAHRMADEAWGESQRRLAEKWRGKDVALEADK